MMKSMQNAIPALKVYQTSGARVEEISSGLWHLEIPAGEQGHYRVAQLDDYQGLPRPHFLWKPPLHITFRGRASAQNLPGTWGFGLWNDPFSLSFAFGGSTRRFPALPNTAWFFHASTPNYLSFRDDLPAHGFLAATFRSPRLPTLLLALASPLAALLLIPGVVRLARWSLRQVIHQAAHQIELDVTTWHTYTLTWLTDRLCMRLDEQIVLDTPIVPQGPLSLVVWIDNQYAALPPRGGLRHGFLPNPGPAWIEMEVRLSNG